MTGGTESDVLVQICLKWHQGRLKGNRNSLSENAFALVPIIQIFSGFENCSTGNTRNVFVIYNRNDSLVGIVGKKFSKKRKMLSVNVGLDALSPST